ncbi:Muscarinic acetylcholine receptor DM1 [Cryptotermes secundus]|uniref:Muscarinic acetylcholine receptor DM1 n=1 Tax=Cryptotermes secundus TaxID=105785 RepID=A0A2J7PQD4_9NEOP|nr:Muscarinic acetylcholine receptor DM1 [Cryptotermes secundus]
MLNGSVDGVLNTSLGPTMPEGPGRFSIPQMVVLAIVAGALSLVTVVGNSMVMISFKIDKQLQTISNYFLFSLAVADFAIGLISMPLFTVYTIFGYWPLGPHICDTWLALDYLASNASVLNLLIISFDRYFSVTRPLTYRAKRTTNRAAIMIGCAWGISLLLWPPWIYSWPYIEGERTVPDRECYIQFIETNHYITFGTAIAAFYVPVTVMCILYWRIWRETEKRQKDLPNLQAGKKDSSKRSNSRDSFTFLLTQSKCTLSPLRSAYIRGMDLRVTEQGMNTGGKSDIHVVSALRRATNARGKRSLKGNRSDEAMDMEDWKRSRSESSTAADELESAYLPHKVGINMPQRRSLHSPLSPAQGGLQKARPLTWAWVRDWCVAWWQSGREDDSMDPDYEDTPSDMGYATPVSVETPLQSSVSRCTSLNVIRDPYTSVQQQQQTPTRQHHLHHFDSRSLPASSRLAARSVSSDSVYTILIRLPPDSASCDGSGAADQPSIKMIADDGVMGMDYNLSLHPAGGFPNSPAITRRPSQMPDIRIPLNAKIIPKQLASGSKALLANAGPKLQHQQKKKKKIQEKKADKKAAKTLSAILLAFIITWTPYNILVLLKPLTACTGCIPQELWDFFYYLCYINSTINPLCYALCNASFRHTYVRILTCKWHNRNRSAMNRAFYN